MAPSPKATLFDESMSPEFREALTAGLVRLNEAFAEAREHVKRAYWCNGESDCAASDHLACCLARTKRRGRTKK